MVRIINAISVRGTWWFFPVVIVLACTGAGLALERLGVVKAFFASPYVAIVAWAALRSGRRGGLLAAALATIIWNVVFVAPPGLHWPSNEELIVYASMFGVAGLIGSYHPPAEPARPSRFIGLLPFVRKRSRSKGDDDASHSFWDVERTGAWAHDCSVGAEYGRIYLERCREYGAPLLGWIIRDMIKFGVYSGVEAGFVGALASNLPHRPRVGLPLVADENANNLHVD